MDEYIGLQVDHPERFVNYLNEHLFNNVQPGVVRRLMPEGDGLAECERYAAFL